MPTGIGKMGFWPRTYRGYFYAPERGIMPRYDEDVRNARKTAERFEREYERRAKEAAACEDDQKRGRLLFGNWMISRRIAKFNYIGECQTQNKHEPVFLVNGVSVCCCGLFDDKQDHFN